MFDRANVRVKAGDGGDGVVAFHREKFVPYGGPDGGDGGKGGDVIVRASGTVDSLRHYRQKRLHRAGDGRDGSGNNRHGKDGADLVLAVPPGTLVYAMEGNEKAMLADLEKPGDKVMVAKGGKGGWGNTHFKSSTNQAPKISQAGEPGEEKNILLDMRLIADAGIIGYPNAGKSTLLAAASAAKPKIAAYPFTTLEPALGVVNIGLESFTLAEIPGLIAGAHLGRGLGYDFLRHAMRTKIFIHLVGGDGASPIDDMLKVNEELALYDPDLARRPQLVVVNKIDLPEVQERLEGIKRELDGAGVRAYSISAATGEGVPELMKEALKLLKAEAGEKRIEGESLPVKVFRPEPRQPKVKVSRAGEEFVIDAPDLGRIKGGAGVTPAELRWQLDYQFRRLGIDKVLEKAGVKAGDKVRLGELSWEWQPREKRK
jgi:GTP-binding protein